MAPTVAHERCMAPTVAQAGADHKRVRGTCRTVVCPRGPFGSWCVPEERVLRESL